MKRRVWAMPTPRRRDEGEGFGQAIELAVSVVLFAFVGLFLDVRFGTRPLWTIVFIGFAAVGGFATAYYRYQFRSAKQDEGKAWTRKAMRDARGELA